MTLAHAAHRRLYENQAVAFRSFSTQVAESSVKLIEVDMFYNLGTRAAKDFQVWELWGETFSELLLLVF